MANRNLSDNTTSLAHLGALLSAVGHVMNKKGISAIAARGGQHDAELVEHMVRHYGLDGTEAEALLEVELSEAINMQ